MIKRTDQVWLRELKQDDPQAVQDLWLLIYTYALNLIKYSAKYRLYGSEDEQDDQVQEVALLAYDRLKRRGIHQFRLNCDFEGYCLRVVVNTMINVRRKRQDESIELKENLVGHVDVDPPGNPEATRAQIQPCLDELDPRRREIIERLFFQGQRPAVVAEQMGLRRNNVNQLAHRARRSLRICLQGLGYQFATDFE